MGAGRGGSKRRGIQQPPNGQGKPRDNDGDGGNACPWCGSAGFEHLGPRPIRACMKCGALGWYKRGEFLDDEDRNTELMPSVHHNTCGGGLKAAYSGGGDVIWMCTECEAAVVMPKTEEQSTG